MVYGGEIWFWMVLEGFGRVWKGLEGFGRVQKVKDSFRWCKVIYGGKQ